MKPRLRHFNGVWHCCYEGMWLGFGYTPRDAYADWIYINKVRRKC